MTSDSASMPLLRGIRHALVRAVAKAWNDKLFTESAAAAFWQTLSLPPLLLGLLGSLGYVGGWFGSDTSMIVQERIVSVTGRVFSPNAVREIIAPTVSDILTTGRGELVSIGFVISLWAGSSAMSSFVDSITIAHGQYELRHPLWQRIFSLLLYVAGLIIGVFALPLLALGPARFVAVLPSGLQDASADVMARVAYPVVALLLVLALTTLYKLALPRKLPWHRGLPGAVLALVVFLIAATGLQIYITVVTKTGYTYGALAAPIAFLLATFFIAMAIILGAQLNGAIQEQWPAGPTRRQRRNSRPSPRSAPAVAPSAAGIQES